MLELSIDAFDNFECIGNLCEDTCCRDWDIVIDQDTYFKYKRVDKPEFKDIFEKGTTRLKCANKNNYALMNLNEDKECMFLDENKLCSVYKMLGPEKMCYTCRIYPRILINIYDTVEKTLTLSCPEACRKILFRENPIEFNLREFDNKNNFNVTKIFAENNKDCFSKEVFFGLQSFAIGLLQNRYYSLEDRLLTLGMFIEDITNKSDNEIFDIIDSYNLKIQNGVFKGISSYINKEDTLDTEIQYCVNIYLSVVHNFKQTKIRDIMAKVEEGLQLSKSNEFDNFKENYISIKNNYANDIFEKYYYVFENYLVSYIYKHPLMFLTRNLMSNYAEMLLYYNMIRFSMIGAIGSLKEETQESDLVLIISTVSRGVEHNETTIKSLKSLVEKLNLNKLSNMTALIIN